MRKEDRRAPYTEEEAKKGRENEYYIDFLLESTEKLEAIKYIWWNKNKDDDKYVDDSYEPYDFTIYWPNGDFRFHLECERKPSDYEIFFHHDYFYEDTWNGNVSFIYSKVWNERRNKDEKCFYYMSVTDEKRKYVEYIVYADMEDIQKYGKKVTRPTAKNNYEMESFMHYPFKKCNVFYPSNGDLSLGKLYD